MAWKLSGQLLESCSCQMVCPCNFGPANPDMGWCSGAIVIDVQKGNSGTVSLSGTKVAWVFDLPHDFAGGNATARIIIDEAANAAQRRELAAIFGGKKGGAFAAFGALITKALPTQYAKITVKNGDAAMVTVGSIGRLKLTKLKDDLGQQAKLQNPPAFRAFGVPSMELASGEGSYWVDPDMRRWVGGGAGSASPITISA